MSKTPEAKVRDPVIKYAERLGIVHIRLYFGPGMHTGWPDDIFLIYDGKPLFMEFKAPGKEPTKKQLYRLKTLWSLGYCAEWVDNPDVGRQHLLFYLETRCMQDRVKTRELEPDYYAKMLKLGVSRAAGMNLVG